MTIEKDPSCVSIQTLKTWVQGELKLIDQKFDSIEKADKLLREQNRIHFETLNNEGRRITAMTEKTVSQDTWKGFMEHYEDRHSALQRALDKAVSKEDFNAFVDRYTERHTVLERLAMASVSRSDFDTYQKTTERALTLKAGQTQGVGQVGAVVLGVFMILTSIASIVAVVLSIRH